MKQYKLTGRLGNLLFQFAHIYSEIKDEPFTVNVCPIDRSRLQNKPEISDNGIFTGYWESEKYFDKDLIRKIYSPTPDLIKEITEKYGDFSNSLFISVRRGDFVKLSHTFVCLNAKYYEDMFTLLNKEYDKVLLTSDDIEWCKLNIHLPSEITYILETPLTIINIGSLCKDFIIGSSTFSWWCAWLGEINGGTIICPTEKFHNGFKMWENKEFYPDRWKKIDAYKYYEDTKKMKVLLCGIAKCENHYIKEWVEWYRDLGVDHIVLYDNNDPDGERFEEVIPEYIDSGYVEVINYRGKTLCQINAYNDCYSKYKNKYDWFLFLDIDELLEVFGSTLKDFLSLKRFAPFLGIKIFWKCFDDNDFVKVENDNYNMYNRFKREAKSSKFTRQSKTIIRGKLNILYKSNVHYPDHLGFICNTLGKWTYPSIISKHVIYDKAVINHYRLKTIEEYITNKMVRLYPDLSEESAKNILTLDKFFRHNSRTPEKEEYAKKLMEQYGHTVCGG